MTINHCRLFTPVMLSAFKKAAVLAGAAANVFARQTVTGSEVVVFWSWG
jgi:hypothetical protein